MDRVPVYTMAVAARLTGLHPQTLRKYERAGLLVPSRGPGNQRLYSVADVDRLRRVSYLVERRGLNVAGVGMTLALTDRLDAVADDASAAELRGAIDAATDATRTPGSERTPAGRPPQGER